MIKNSLADFFLMFGQLYVVLAFIALGLLTPYRKIFYQALILCACDIVINVALKGTFQTKLPFSLHSLGYAFPSGHMQFTTVFYGWLAIKLAPSWKEKALLMLLLIGIGAGLVHHDYHYPIDVFVGAIVGGMILYTACHAMWIWPYTCVFIISVLMLYNTSIYASTPPHAWKAYWLLLAITLFDQIKFRLGLGPTKTIKPKGVSNSQQN